MDNGEFEAIAEAVRDFVNREVIPREEEIEESDSVPEVLREEAAKMGLFGYALPEEYGGLGFTMVEEVRLAFEVGRTSPAFRSLFGTNNGIAGQTIANYGTEEQKRHYLPELASGAAIGCFALTEAEAGSDPSGMRTRAKRAGDEYVINGTKRFITNAELSTVFVVFARTDPDAEGTKGISAFLVDAGTPGLTIGPHDKKMGQQGAWTSELFLDDVRVPASALIGGEEETGFRAAMKSLAKGRLTIGSLCVGMAERIVEEMTAYAIDNRQGGVPIGDFQLVQALLAESETEARAGRAMALEAARAYDAGTDMRQGPACTKLFCSQMVNKVADRGVQVLGGMGYMRTVPIERFYRDARLYRIYEGTDEIQKLVIARQMLAARRAKVTA
ncbi:MAG: acyl-CoA dehydrogenase family protein [Actinobacteria bacterium]|nr:acyl-CoA dehydrogenase family protein [Actinomycetota bacterium]